MSTPRTDALEGNWNTNSHQDALRLARQLERELAAEQQISENLLRAAKAVVERWDTPLWKDVPATATFINKLRNAIAKAESGDAPEDPYICPIHGQQDGQECPRC